MGRWFLRRVRLVAVMIVLVQRVAKVAEVGTEGDDFCDGEKIEIEDEFLRMSWKEAVESGAHSWW